MSIPLLLHLVRFKSFKSSADVLCLLFISSLTKFGFISARKLRGDDFLSSGFLVLNSFLSLRLSLTMKVSCCYVKWRDQTDDDAKLLKWKITDGSS